MTSCDLCENAGGEVVWEGDDCRIVVAHERDHPGTCRVIWRRHVKEMTDIIRQAILHDGFSVVEILSQCPTYFGRKNKIGDAAAMMRQFKDATTPIGSKAAKSDPSLIERGIFLQVDRPEYCSEYDKVIERARSADHTTT